jgi:predicted naringenin-chalcone synthase
MSLRIAGLGVAVPEHAMSQTDAAELLVSFLPGEGRPRAVRALYARSGIGKRHSVLLSGADGAPGERQSFYSRARDQDDQGPGTAARMQAFEAAAPHLVSRAAADALRDSGLAAGEITDLVTVSCTGFFAPGLDTALIERLGLRGSVERTHVGFMGCHGAMNGLRVASALTGADPRARVLLCSVELCSLHLALSWEPQALVANSLFSDGAAALVGVPPQASDPAAGWRVVAQGTLLFPDSADAMSWRVGDHGFRMTLSPEVPTLIQAHVGDWLRGWLEEQGLTVDDVRTWAVHPGGPRILSAFGQGMDLPRKAFSASREVLADYGNMSSATLLFILQRLRSAGAPTPLVALAFGPGLTAEVALIV